MSDSAGWVLDGIARDLHRELAPALRSARVNHGWQSARDCVIHFIDRPWAYAEGVLDGVHRSNYLIAKWSHGQTNTPDEVLRASLSRLRRMQDRFTRIHVMCRAGEETMRVSGVPTERVVLLPEGVDLLRFGPPRCVADRERIRLALGVSPDAVAVGCFQKDGLGWGEGLEPKWIKAPEILVDVLERLHKRFRIHAVIPGPARGYVKRALASRNVPFTAPGFCASRRLAALYHALDLYICPSRDEGGPAALLESMASGVPVVSTRVGMAADLLRDGENGFIADVEDVEGLEARASWLIEDVHLRDRIALSALQDVRPYAWPMLAQRYVHDLYRPVLNERHHGRPIAALHL